MINYNGTLVERETKIFGVENRAFKYGDGLFETIKVENGEVRFIEDHYFRLMASMRMIRMEIPMSFTLDFMENEIMRTVKENGLNEARVRFSVFRASGGLYTPENNTTEYVIEANEIQFNEVEAYEVDLFKDYYVYSGLLSTIKSTNKLVNVLAGTYAAENNIDNCILLNEQKKVVEFTNGNLFLIKGLEIMTPPITDGCIKGIIRKKILENPGIIEGYRIVERNISPFDLQKADELFMTNAIIGVLAITKYRKKNFGSAISTKIKEFLENGTIV